MRVVKQTCEEKVDIRRQSKGKEAGSLTCVAKE